MKVLVITSRDLEKGSTHFRISQYTDFLKDHGITLEFIQRSSINSSFLGKLGEFELVINQKCLMNQAVSRKIITLSRRIFFDFDDAIYTRPGRPHSLVTGLRVRRRFRLWMEKPDLVMTSNRILANKARQYASSVVIIPMAVDTQAWKPAEKKEPLPITIGWAGSPVNVPNLERLDAVLFALLKKHRHLRLAVYSGKKPRLSCTFKYYPYKTGTGPSFTQSLDIGLLPLVNEEYSMGKSPIKAIQYLACGVPVVGNIFGAGSEILNTENSISVTSDEEWFNALERLILQENLRRSMGEAGRQFVLKHHNIYIVRDQLFQLLSGNEKPVSEISHS